MGCTSGYLHPRAQKRLSSVPGSGAVSLDIWYLFDAGFISDTLMSFRFVGGAGICGISLNFHFSSPISTLVYFHMTVFEWVADFKLGYFTFEFCCQLWQFISFMICCKATNIYFLFSEWITLSSAGCFCLCDVPRVLSSSASQIIQVLMTSRTSCQRMLSVVAHSCIGMAHCSTQRPISFQVIRQELIFKDRSLKTTENFALL